MAGGTIAAAIFVAPAGSAIGASDCGGEGRWTSIGGGINGQVRSVVTFDDGTGLATYAAGDFTTAGAVACARIARWNGESWSPVGDGFNNRVHALAVHDDGSGPALYAGGAFTASGSTPIDRIARWDGKQWQPVGDGFDQTVLVLTSVSDEGLAGLYAGGSFSQSGPNATDAIARWDGVAWQQVGEGVQWGPAADGPWSSPASVNDIVLFDFGDGPRLVAGGFFSRSGEVAAVCITQWDGIAMSSVGDLEVTECYLDWYELLGSVADLHVTEGPEGPTLMAAVNTGLECGFDEGCGCMGFGSFVRGRASKWTAAGWQTVFERSDCTTDCICDYGNAAILGIADFGGTQYLATDISHSWWACDWGGEYDYFHHLFTSREGPFQLAESQPLGTPNHLGVFDRITAPPVLWISSYFGLEVLICDAPCAADLDGNGSVDGSDIAILLGAWGSAGNGTPADIVADGVVNGADLSALLSAWGDCP